MMGKIRSNLPKEVFIIGGSTVLVGVPLLLLANKAFNVKGGLSLVQLVGVMFATGAAMHIIYEVTGGNKYFCEKYSEEQNK